MGKNKKRIIGSADRPRLSVYRANQNIYAQIIDDFSGRTIVSSSTLNMELKNKSNKEAAKMIGQEIAKKAKEKGINSVVFDRRNYLYHGRVKALADAAREGGLKF